MSKKDQVKSYLIKHGSITPMQSLFIIGLYRLGGRIRELRLAGWQIETQLTRCGRDIHTKYILIKAV